MKHGLGLGIEIGPYLHIQYLIAVLLNTCAITRKLHLEKKNAGAPDVSVYLYICYGKPLVRLYSIVDARSLIGTCPKVHDYTVGRQMLGGQVLPRPCLKGGVGEGSIKFPKEKITEVPNECNFT